MLDISMPGMTGWEGRPAAGAPKGMDEVAIMMVSAEAQEFSAQNLGVPASEQPA